MEKPSGVFEMIFSLSEDRARNRIFKAARVLFVVSCACLLLWFLIMLMAGGAIGYARGGGGFFFSLLLSVGLFVLAVAAVRLWLDLCVVVAKISVTLDEILQELKRNRV